MLHSCRRCGKEFHKVNMGDTELSEEVLEEIREAAALAQGGD